MMRVDGESVLRRVRELKRFEGIDVKLFDLSEWEE